MNKGLISSQFKTFTILHYTNRNLNCTYGLYGTQPVGKHVDPHAPTSAIDYGVRHNKMHFSGSVCAASSARPFGALQIATWRLPSPGMCRNEAPPNATMRMICATTYPCATTTTSVCHAAAGTCSIGMPLSTVSARHSVCGGGGHNHTFSGQDGGRFRANPEDHFGHRGAHVYIANAGMRLHNEGEDCNGDVQHRRRSIRPEK